MSSAMACQVEVLDEEQPMLLSVQPPRRRTADLELQVFLQEDRGVARKHRELNDAVLRMGLAARLEKYLWEVMEVKDVLCPRLREEAGLTSSAPNLEKALEVMELMEMHLFKSPTLQAAIAELQHLHKSVGTMLGGAQGDLDSVIRAWERRAWHRDWWGGICSPFLAPFQVTYAMSAVAVGSTALACSIKNLSGRSTGAAATSAGVVISAYILWMKQGCRDFSDAAQKHKTMASGAEQLAGWYHELQRMLEGALDQLHQLQEHDTVFHSMQQQLCKVIVRNTRDVRTLDAQGLQDMLTHHNLGHVVHACVAWDGMFFVDLMDADHIGSVGITERADVQKLLHLQGLAKDGGLAAHSPQVKALLDKYESSTDRYIENLKLLHETAVKWRNMCTPQS